MRSFGAKPKKTFIYKSNSQQEMILRLVRGLIPSNLHSGCITSTSVSLHYVRHVLHSGSITSTSVLLNYVRHVLHSGCITSTPVLLNYVSKHILHSGCITSTSVF